jgi:hypothetical protein
MDDFYIKGDQNNSQIRTQLLIVSRFLPDRSETVGKTVNIYVYMQGRRRGPYEKAQLEEMWKRGELPMDALYWHDCMPQWAVISELFADTIMANTTGTPASPDPKHGCQSTTTPDQSYA